MENRAQSRRVGCSLFPRNKKGLRYRKSGAPESGTLIRTFLLYALFYFFCNQFKTKP